MKKTRKKLREAAFFLRLLEEQSRLARQEEECDFYYSAFVSAGRSITFVLQKEHGAVYLPWREGWFSKLSESDLRICKLMLESRNVEQKEGSQDREVVWKFKSVDRCTARELGGKVYWTGPPGTPAPEFGFPVQHIEVDGKLVEVVPLCRRYYELMKQLLRDFVKDHQSLLPEYLEAEQ